MVVDEENTVYLALHDGPVAVDGATGAVRWHCDGRPNFHSGLALAPGGVLVSSGASYDRQAFGWHARTGMKLWTASLPGYGSGPACDTANLAFVAAGERAVAVDTLTGAIVWQVNDPHFYMVPSARGNTVVYLGGEGRGTGKGMLIALDTATGKERWRAPLPGQAFRFSASGAVCAITWTEPRGTRYIEALDARSGKRLWMFACPPGTFPYQLSIGPNDTVYVTRSENGPPPGGRSDILTALEAPSGRIRWSFHCKEAGFGSCLFGLPGRAYIQALRDRSREWTLFCLDSRTGRPLWEHSEPLQGFIYGAPAVGPDGSIYVALENKEHRVTLLSLDGETGKERWRTSFPPPPRRP